MRKTKITIGLAFGSMNPKLDLTKDTWKNTVQKIEQLGFSGIFYADHFYPIWDPIAAMTGTAAITNKIDVGSMVCCVDYRNPVIYAKASATINLISNGRHIFGIGAGWDQNDYTMAGIPYDKPETRIQRLEEALQIIKGMWTQKNTSFDGKYYRVKDLPEAVSELDYAKPRLMIGGGGNRVLRLAGRHADVANIYFKIQNTEDWLRRAVQDGGYNRLGEKVETVKRAAVKAGRDIGDIVFSQWIATRRIHGDPVAERRGLAERFGASVKEIEDCTWVMVGEPKEVVEGLRQRYEDFGISHYIIDSGDSPDIEDLEFISENIVKPLAYI
jgi:probable F420-dependent oxidoreductase